MNQLHTFAIPALVGTQEPLDIMSNNQTRISLRKYFVHARVVPYSTLHWTITDVLRPMNVFSNL